MQARIEINRDTLALLWAKGLTGGQIAARMGVSESTVMVRAREYNLPARPLIRQRRQYAAQPAFTPAPVVVPPEPLDARPDWPDLLAAVQRAKGAAKPEHALGVIAARFRLPVDAVRGLAGRVAP